MASAKALAPKWARNTLQWLRTAKTDVHHAIGQAEIGKKDDLVAEYARLAKRLRIFVQRLEREYGVAPSKGRRELRGE